MKIYIGNKMVWDVPKYTFNDPHMGVRSISIEVEHPAHCLDSAIDVPDFKDAYVSYKGESYYISSAKPTGEKSNSNINYKYSLLFKGAEYELGFRKIRNLALTGIDTFISQGTRFSIYANLETYVQLIQTNLDYYYKESWIVNFTGEAPEVRLDIDNMSVLELLQKSYEFYGVRWRVSGNQINIGYEPETVPYVFDYGVEGGLAKISRTAPTDGVYNRVIGSGGSRNLPVNYFSNRHPNFPLDPNPISGDVNIKNLMPKAFRDSVISGEKPYKDYAEDLASIAEIGVRETALAPNDDIYPSIAGVEKPGIGRIDQIIAYENIDDKTFNIWLKDIGFDLSDDIYTTTEEAKISFTSGMLAGYEFVILAYEGVREVIVDTSKSHNGVNSKYKVTLIKSEEDADIGRPYIPYDGLEPNAGDAFVIYHIEMPHEYVLNAEIRLQGWLEDQLSELKIEKPTYVIEPYDSFLDVNPSILTSIASGNKIKVNNAKLTQSILELYINSVSVEYRDSRVPKYTITVSDKVNVDGGTINKLASKIEGIENRQYFSLQEIKDIIDKIDLSKYLSKVNPDTAQGLITFLEGVEVGTFTTGALGSGAALKMVDGTSYAEVDNLIVRQKATFRELIIESLKHIGGQLVLTPARMKCVRVVEEDTFYKCYFDTGDGEVTNEFVAGDFARCQVFTGSGTKFYWRLVTLVGEDWINLSKTSAAVGSDAPEAGDDIAQLGNATDPTRQNAQILSTVGVDAPSWKQYKGINSFSLEGKDTTVFSGNGNKISGETVFKSDGKNLEEALDDVEERVLGLRIGGVNLLRNTGFLGDFKSLNLNSSAILNGSTAIDTNPLIHWVHSNVNVIDAPSKSGKGIHLGSLQQNTPVLEVGETYIVSFKAKGANLNIGLVNTVEVTLTGEYQLFEYKMIPTETKSYVFSMTGDADVYEIQLEKATIRSDYNYSIEDDLKAISQLQAINTITAAIKEADTSILGGLILTSMLQLGKYKDGVMEKVNAGINGIYNNDDDPAIWAGGSFDDAIRTVQRLIDNPNYEPSEAEWAEMANIVMTHGGDGFFKGYIYALGGLFRGRVETNIDGNRIIIDPQKRELRMINQVGRPVLIADFNVDPSNPLNNFSQMRLNRHNADGVIIQQINITPSKIGIEFDDPDLPLKGSASFGAYYMGMVMQEENTHNHLYTTKASFHANYDGANGNLSLTTTGLPTSSTGLSTGRIYSDNGTIKIKQ